MALRARSCGFKPKPHYMSTIFGTKKCATRSFSDIIAITFVTADGEEVLASVVYECFRINNIPMDRLATNDALFLFF